jgi:hypothetical protein
MFLSSKEIAIICNYNNMRNSGHHNTNYNWPIISMNFIYLTVVINSYNLSLTMGTGISFYIYIYIDAYLAIYDHHNTNYNWPIISMNFIYLTVVINSYNGNWN